MGGRPVPISLGDLCRVLVSGCHLVGLISLGLAPLFQNALKQAESASGCLAGCGFIHTPCLVAGSRTLGRFILYSVQL